MSTAPTEILETAETTLETLFAEAASAVDTTAAAEGALDIQSIKDMMDAFDPAALLPDLGELFGSLAPLCRFAVLIGPVVLLILGLAYLLFSPKEANHYFGYRCYYGMGSVQAWRFTQRLAGIVLGGLGLILTIVMHIISSEFALMEITDMVFKAVDCLIIQAAAAILATLVINLTCFIRFDHRGEYRKAKKKKKQ